MTLDLAAPSVPADLDTPALLIDVAALERNIWQMAVTMQGRGIDLRPHVKTHKSAHIARLQMDAGATGLTVGTVGEAEVMAAAGLRDIFLAYPIWTDGRLAARVRALHDAIRLIVGVESVAAATMLGKAVRGCARPLEVLVELDSGARRTGTTAPAEAIRVAAASREAGLRVRGVFTHGGHGYRPGASAMAASDEVRVLANTAQALIAAGFEVDVLSAGATPTAMLSARPPVTEERPGTYIFGDRQQLYLGAVRPEDIALWVIATVVSTAVPGQFVINAGSKTLGGEVLSFLQGFGLIPEIGAIIERAYDYHGVVSVPSGASAPALGQRVAIVPNHACPVANLADHFVVLRDGRIIAEWPIDARCRNG